MAGFTFNITDMAAMMNAKDIVTKKIIEMVKTNPKVCYINSDGTGHAGPLRDLYEEFPDRGSGRRNRRNEHGNRSCRTGKKRLHPIRTGIPDHSSASVLFDQIHNDLAYNDLPVRLIGTTADFPPAMVRLIIPS